MKNVGLTKQLAALGVNFSFLSMFEFNIFSSLMAAYGKRPILSRKLAFLCCSVGVKWSDQLNFVKNLDIPKKIGQIDNNLDSII